MIAEDSETACAAGLIRQADKALDHHRATLAPCRLRLPASAIIARMRRPPSSQFGHGATNARGRIGQGQCRAVAAIRAAMKQENGPKLPAFCADEHGVAIEREEVKAQIGAALSLPNEIDGRDVRLAIEQRDDQIPCGRPLRVQGSGRGRRRVDFETIPPCMPTDNRMRRHEPVGGGATISRLGYRG
jgi:hypothetical protein